MPIYEYLCNACRHEFEVLVLPWKGDTGAPECPSCRSQNLERRLSAFAVNSDATRKTNLADGRRHAMKDHKEKEDAERKEIIEHMNEH